MKVAIYVMHISLSRSSEECLEKAIYQKLEKKVIESLGGHPVFFHVHLRLDRLSKPIRLERVLVLLESSVFCLLGVRHLTEEIVLHRSVCPTALNQQA